MQSLVITHAVMQSPCDVSCRVSGMVIMSDSERDHSMGSLMGSLMVRGPDRDRQIKDNLIDFNLTDLI